jgi:hypothetical protein
MFPASSWRADAICARAASTAAAAFAASACAPAISARPFFAFERFEA